MIKFFKFVFALGVVAAVAIVAMRLIFPLPDLDARLATNAFPAPSETQLGRVVRQLAEPHPGKTGISPLPLGADAFASRVLLAEAAQESIDAQYYIWHKDKTGLLLLKTLYDAAERGVRVRLLLDDNGTPDIGSEIAALNSHPKIEIRLFNPIAIRNPRILGFVIDPFRVNRRMHNKSFTVDGSVSIIGGRNVGDEYFGTGSGSLFADLDVLAIGGVVGSVSGVFDLYWNSASSYPAELMMEPEAGGIRSFLSDVIATYRDPATAVYTDQLQNTVIINQLLQKSLPLEWVDVQLVNDDPEKALGSASIDQLLVFRLGAILGKPRKIVDLVSAYFVPGYTGKELFLRLAGQGASVRILTNAYDSTDVVLVHSGYAKYRSALLQGGIRLFELKPKLGASPESPRSGAFGSSRASLHAKTFAIDDKRVFIGSFNFDPRSALLNCEMGFLIESPVLAGQLSGLFNDQIVLDSYEVKLAEDGELVWLERAGDGSMTRHEQEPSTTWVSRTLITMAGWLPIEWLL